MQTRIDFKNNSMCVLIINTLSLGHIIILLIHINTIIKKIE